MSDKSWDTLQLAMLLLFVTVLSAICCHYVWKDEEAKRDHAERMQQLQLQQEQQNGE